MTPQNSIAKGIISSHKLCQFQVVWLPTYQLYKPKPDPLLVLIGLFYVDPTLPFYLIFKKKIGIGIKASNLTMGN